MKYFKLLFFLFSAFLFTGISAESNDVSGRIKYPGKKAYMFRVYLSDKQGTPYSLDKPWEFLSERAVARRMRQHVKVDSTDIPVSRDYIKDIASTGVDVVSSSKWNNTVLVRCRKTELIKGVEALRFVKGVMQVWASPDSVKRAVRRSKIHDGFTHRDSVDGNRYGKAAAQIQMLDGNRLHESGFRGEGMLIAVLDGGFMNVDMIPCFRDVDIRGAKDFVVPPAESVFDEMDHGTRTLSVMAANCPYVYVGTAPEASYLLLRCEDGQTESRAEEDYWAAAAEYADSVGVDVISSSLGFHSFDDQSSDYRYSELDGSTALISRTASMLAGKGIVLVNSAGNDGMSAWKKINVPADADNIITVGAVSPNRRNAAFSSIGPTADGRVKPDVMAPGSPTRVITGRGTIIHDMGTSFSTPVVSGLVACLWQAFKDKTAFEIIDMVRKCSDNYLTPDNIYGYGIPDFWKAYTTGKAAEDRYMDVPAADMGRDMPLKDKENCENAVQRQAFN